MYHLITRSSAGVKVVKTDYSRNSLQSVLSGQDAVISLVGSDFAAQKPFIDAAIAVGVKRFIPSDFGSDISSEKVVQAAPFLESKREVVEYLRTKEDKITWTSIVNGAFFDWGLKLGFWGADLTKKQAVFWDDGAAKFVGTNLTTIAKTLVAILSDANYEKTKNEYVRIGSHVQSQQDILESLRRGTGEEWPVVARNSLDDFIKASREKLAQGDESAAPNLLMGILFGKEQLGVYGRLWNNTLGLPEENLDGTVKAVLEGNLP